MGLAWLLLALSLKVPQVRGFMDRRQRLLLFLDSFEVFSAEPDGSTDSIRIETTVSTHLFDRGRRNSQERCGFLDIEPRPFPLVRRDRERERQDRRSNRVLDALLDPFKLFQELLFHGSPSIHPPTPAAVALRL